MYQFLEEVVADHMTLVVKTVTRNIAMDELRKCFEADDFNAYPVVEHKEVVGLITKFDFLRLFVFTPARMIPRYDDLMQLTVGDAMTSDFIYVNPATKLTRVLQLMAEHRVRSIPVIHAEYGLSGIISREDMMRALWLCTRKSS